MSLISGVGIETIADHLALVFVLAVRPDRRVHAFERIHAEGKEIATKVTQPLRDEYGGFNSDVFNEHGVSAFGRNEVEKLENEIIKIAESQRDEILLRARLYKEETKAVEWESAKRGI